MTLMTVMTRPGHLSLGSTNTFPHRSSDHATRESEQSNCLNCIKNCQTLQKTAQPRPPSSVCSVLLSHLLLLTSNCVLYLVICPLAPLLKGLHEGLLLVRHHHVHHSRGAARQRRLGALTNNNGLCTLYIAKSQLFQMKYRDERKQKIPGRSHRWSECHVRVAAGARSCPRRPA